MRYIISAELSTLDQATNKQRSNDLKALLRSHGLNARLAIGRYKGIDETSYLIETDSIHASNAYETMIELARLFDQECFLALSGGHGTLIGPNGTTLGQLIFEETLTDIRPSEDHTAIKTGERYLILKGR